MSIQVKIASRGPLFRSARTGTLATQATKYILMNFKHCLEYLIYLLEKPNETKQYQTKVQGSFISRYLRKINIGRKVKLQHLIPNEEGITIASNTYETFYEYSPPIPTHFIKEMLQLILKTLSNLMGNTISRPWWKYWVKGTKESTLEVDSSVPLTHHDPKDLGLSATMGTKMATWLLPISS